MYLENLVADSVTPKKLGRFWEATLGGEQLTDEPGSYETRLAVEGGPVLDLCFQQVPEPTVGAARLHLDLVGSDRQTEVVDRLLALGARRLDTGQGEVPWVVLADPEDNPFCVLEQREVYDGAGPLAAFVLDSADPDRDAEFWSWLTGWTQATSSAPRSLRHPSGGGPFLELVPETTAKQSDHKNPLHLDIRLEQGDDPDALREGILERGGADLHRPEWGELPWRSYTDPSGNELCLLPAPKGQRG